MREETKREEVLLMNNDKLRSVAKAIVAKQKGILAADESSPTITKRFDSVKVECTEENRRRYREILFTTEGIEHYIGGVILFDETLRQGTRDGTPFAELLSSCGIVPGIKVDKGARALALYPGDEQVLIWRQSYDTPPPPVSKCFASVGIGQLPEIG
jgi:fructose-bisphosphate aldolase, class I